MYYNLNTSNRSFVILGYQLKSFGISNWQWMLYLKNESLENVDPYDPNLTRVQKLDILKECIENPIYFFREIFRMPSTDGIVRDLNLNKATAAKLWCQLNLDLPTITMTARQTSKTVVGYGIIVYKFLFEDNQRIMVQNKQTGHSKIDMCMIGKILNALPDYIRMYRDYNIQEKTITMLNNSICSNKIRIGKSPRNSKDSYENAATGLNETHTMVNDMVDSPYFYAWYLRAIPSAGMMDINTVYFEESRFLREHWNECVHWNDKFYDATKEDILHLPEMRSIKSIFIHYEPAELLPFIAIYRIEKMLDYDGDGVDEEEWKREMCIHPFE